MTAALLIVFAVALFLIYLGVRRETTKGRTRVEWHREAALRDAVVRAASEARVAAREKAWAVAGERLEIAERARTHPKLSDWNGGEWDDEESAVTKKKKKKATPSVFDEAPAYKKSAARKKKKRST